MMHDFDFIFFIKMLEASFDPGWDEGLHKVEGQFCFVVLRFCIGNHTDKYVSEKFQTGEAE